MEVTDKQAEDISTKLVR